MHPTGKYWGSFLPEIRWTLIVAILTLVSAFIHEKNKGDWLKFKETKLFITFVFFVGLQFPFVMNTEWHQIYFILLVKLLILYFLLITVVNSKDKLIGVIVANLIGCAYIGLTALQTHTGGRFETAGLPSINDSNLLAIHVIPIVIIGAFLFLGDAIKRKYWLLLPLAFAANLIIMTGSRGGIGGLVGAGFFIIIFSSKDFRGTLIKWGVLALLSLSFVSADLIINRIQQVTEAETSEDIDESAQSRIVIIEAQLEMFKDDLMVGGGHRATLLLSPLYIPKQYLTGKGVRGSHNLTMAILVDHGFIGGILYFFIIFVALKNALFLSKKIEYDRNLRLISLGVGVGLLSVMMTSQFSNSKVLEITVWLVAFIVILQKIITLKNHEEDRKQERVNVT